MSHNQQSMLDGVWDKLTAVQTAGTFYDDVGGRIYQDEAPDEEPLPAAVILLTTDFVDRYFDGEDIDAEFDIAVYGSKTDGMRSLAGTVKTLIELLDNATDVSITGFDSVEVQCTERGVRLWDDGRPQIVTSWTITARAT